MILSTKARRILIAAIEQHMQLRRIPDTAELAKLADVENSTVASVLDTAFDQANKSKTAHPQAKSWRSILRALRIDIQSVFKEDLDLFNEVFKFLGGNPKDPREIAEWHSDLAEKLPQQQSTKDLLDYLLLSGRQRGFTAIRFYRFNEKEQSLISVECSGNHSSEVEQGIRDGRIVSFKLRSPEDSSDAYICLHLNRPVLFKVDDTQDEEIRAVDQFGDHTPQRIIKANLGARMLGLPGVLASQRVDFPLVLRERFPDESRRIWVGKLSCDIETPNETHIDEFSLIIRDALGTLKALSERELDDEIEPSFQTAVQRIKQCTSIPELYSYCTGNMASKLFSCHHSSIFENLEDSATHDFDLILRTTTFTPLKRRRNTATYTITKDPMGLTAWVGCKSRTVRMHTLLNEDARLAQYEAYGDRIRWSETPELHDSRDHTSYLAVPIMDTLKRVGEEPKLSDVLGVIRVTEKRPNSSPYPISFSEADQRLLEKLAPEIAYQLRLLRESTIRTLTDNLYECFSLIEKASNLEELWKAILTGMKTIFKESADNRKLFLINEIDADALRFHHAAAEGSFSNSISMGDTHDLSGTLTELAERLGPKCVNLNNLDRAKQRRYFKELIAACKFAMACAVTSQDNGDGRSTFAVLVVESEHMDYSVACEGAVMQKLCGWASRKYPECARNSAPRSPTLSNSGGEIGVIKDIAKELNKAEGIKK